MEWGPVKSGLILKIKPNLQGSRFSPTRDTQRRMPLASGREAVQWLPDFLEIFYFKS